MKTAKRYLTAAAFLMALGGQAHAATQQPGDCGATIRPDLLQRAQVMAQNARDRQIRDFAEASTATLEGGGTAGQQPGSPGAANSSSASCLERYRDVSVSGMLGIPSMGDIAQEALARVGQAACNSAENLYNQAADNMRQEIMLPGNIGGAAVGLPGGNQQMPAVRAPSAGTILERGAGGAVRETIQEIPGYIRGIFR